MAASNRTTTRRSGPSPSYQRRRDPLIAVSSKDLGSCRSGGTRRKVDTAALLARFNMQEAYSRPSGINQAYPAPRKPPAIRSSEIPRSIRRFRPPPKRGDAPDTLVHYPPITRPRNSWPQQSTPHIWVAYAPEIQHTSAQARRTRRLRPEFVRFSRLSPNRRYATRGSPLDESAST